MTLSQQQRDSMTLGQQQRLAETRDCPACAGRLDRIEIYEEDQMIVERYRHHGGDGGCEGNEPENGFWRENGQYVIHYRGYSEGGGILREEFDL